MTDKLKQLILILGIAAIIVCIIMTIIMFIGSMNITDGCLLRYDPDKGAGTTDSVTNSFMLDAMANYTLITTNKPDGTIENQYDPNGYGDWLNSNMSVAKDQEIKLKIEGEISLCKAYVPGNNLQQTSNLDTKGNKVPIPRVEEVDAEPLSLIFDAKTDEWRNIAELYNDDRLIVSILPNQKKLANIPNSISVKNAFVMIKDGVNYKNRIDTADCSEGKTVYNPLCGRYSIYSGRYVDKCKWEGDYYNKQTSICHPNCIGCSDFTCFFDRECCPKKCQKVGAYAAEYSNAPKPYQDDDIYSFPWSNELKEIFFNSELRCTYTDDVPTGACPDPGNYSTKDAVTINDTFYQNNKRFWYTADGPTGLLYRLDNNETPTSLKSLGSNYQFAKVDANDKEYEGINNGRNENTKYQIIYNITSAGSAKQYLQYRLWSGFADYSKNTGGYVLNVKQTKCRRKNGSSYDDPGFAKRGKVQYMIVPYEEDIKTCDSACSVNDINTNVDGNATIKMDKAGYLYMRILNKPEDYKDSYGRYKVQMLTSMEVGSFTLNILNPLFQLLRDKVENASVTIFKNMTCYGGGSNCSNFFTYIKLTLILYVMTYGAMFILGIVKINQQDLLVRIAKIAMVSGLMNDSTFEFFNHYIRPLVSNFSDGIISNMSGYSMFSTTNTITNPFMFLDAVMSKILFGKTFSAQLMSFLSMGLSGLIYFVIVFIAVMIVIITALRAIAVYVMAFMAVAILVGIAPLFLTFMLFDFTRYLFDNWVRFTFRYMMEPVILMAGIIVMTQLFTIYLDYVLGFSVCWKCALPIKMPFINIPGFTPAFVDVPIFCINWFTPWGMDYRSGMMGVNMQHFIALIIIAYGMYGYVEFSGKMVSRLTNASGLSATNMARAMSDAAENKVLGKVGLDEANRQKIKREAKKRLTSRNKALGRANKERSEGKTNDAGQGQDDGGAATS